MFAFKDLLVVSLEQAVAAPFCSNRLAQAGARVIKIERADGDFARGYDDAVHGESAYFVWLNQGKESLVADIKNADDSALIHRMLAQADVFIQNLAPGAAARAGLGSEELRQRYPRLVCCDISGYGDSGDYSKMKAYDLLVQVRVRHGVDYRYTRRTRPHRCFRLRHQLRPTGLQRHPGSPDRA